MCFHYRNESLDEAPTGSKDYVYTQTNHTFNGPSQFDTTYSLLMQLQVLDKTSNKVND